MLVRHRAHRAIAVAVAVAAVQHPRPVIPHPVTQTIRSTRNPNEWRTVINPKPKNGPPKSENHVAHRLHQVPIKVIITLTRVTCLPLGIILHNSYRPTNYQTFKNKSHAFHPLALNKLNLLWKIIYSVNIYIEHFPIPINSSELSFDADLGPFDYTIGMFNKVYTFLPSSLYNNDFLYSHKNVVLS